MLRRKFLSLQVIAEDGTLLERETSQAELALLLNEHHLSWDQVKLSRHSEINPGLLKTCEKHSEEIQLSKVEGGVKNKIAAPTRLTKCGLALMILGVLLLWLAGFNLISSYLSFRSKTQLLFDDLTGAALTPLILIVLAATFLRIGNRICQQQFPLKNLNHGKSK